MARCARYKGQAPAATRGLSVSIFRPKARTLPRAPHSRSGRCGASRPDWICRLKVWRAATTCKATVLAPVQRSRSGARGEGRTRGRSLHSVTASARSTRTQSRQRTRVRSASLSWSLAHRHTAAWYRGPCSAALAILERRHSWREISGGRNNESSLHPGPGHGLACISEQHHGHEAWRTHPRACAAADGIAGGADLRRGDQEVWRSMLFLP